MKHAWLIVVLLHYRGTLPVQRFWSGQDVPRTGGGGMPRVSVQAFSVSSFGGRELHRNKAARGCYSFCPVGMTGTNSYNPMDHETPEEREERMKLVRDLQKTFYKDEEGPKVPELVGIDKDPDVDSSVIQNLPLWRVQWTELPGSQNVLNVHVPHYTNMFQKILKGKVKKWGECDENDGDNDDDDDDDDDGDGGDGFFDFGDEMPEPLGLADLYPESYYFGHIFLPGGSENLDDEAYALEEGDIGTLMKISDARQQDDGRLTLVVQALEKFQIKRVERSHSPYAIADVTIVPDSEQLLEVHPDTSNTTIRTDETDSGVDHDGSGSSNKSAWGEAVKWALGNHFFEYRSVSIDECEITQDDGTVVGLGVSPLSNYDKVRQTLVPNEELECRTQTNHYRDCVAVAESDTWIQLDELLKLLKVASNGVGVPVPTQILGLLPVSRSVVSETEEASVEKVPWPNNFLLEGIVERMKGNKVGTHSKSPFVRIDGNTFDYVGNTMYYSPLRRAQRLSYVVWTLSESIALPPEPGTNGKDKFGQEAILGIASTQERLELATEKMNNICLLLRNALRRNS